MAWPAITGHRFEAVAYRRSVVVKKTRVLTPVTGHTIINDTAGDYINPS
jgi:hypothetical protein